MDSPLAQDMPGETFAFMPLAVGHAVDVQRTNWHHTCQHKHTCFSQLMLSFDCKAISNHVLSRIYNAHQSNKLQALPLVACNDHVHEDGT
jgi:hypothetical protein